MPEPLSKIRKRAKRLGFKQSQITRNPKGKGYFIAPKGVTKTKAKNAYAACRGEGGKKSTCAAVAHNIQSGKKMRRKKK